VSRIVEGEGGIHEPNFEGGGQKERRLEGGESHKSFSGSLRWGALP